jgi:uncharacterized protein (TIGR02118 family)
MTKISVMYPNSLEVKLEMVYSKNKHIALLPMTLVTKNLNGLELDLGIAKVTPSDSELYNTITQVFFKDRAFFKTSFKPHREPFAADVKNNSNVKGHIQISKLITF